MKIDHKKLSDKEFGESIQNWRKRLIRTGDWTEKDNSIIRELYARISNEKILKKEKEIFQLILKRVIKSTPLKILLDPEIRKLLVKMTK